MDALNIAICDDDAVFREMLVSELRNYSSYTGVEMNISSFSSGLELMISEIKYSLIFLDYKMGIMNGIETAKKLRNKGLSCPIIFVTSYNEVVYEVFEVNAFRFIKKPVEADVLKKALDDVVMQYKNRRMVSIISDDGSSANIMSDEILYIEGRLRGCTIYTENEKYKVGQSINGFDDVLPTDVFFRSHRKYIVNMKFVKSFDAKSVCMKNGAIVKLKNAKYDEFKSVHDEFCEHYIV